MSSRGNISATEDTIGSILSRNYRYVVPEYQRQYSWGPEQWEDFWRDLNSIDSEETHFLGSIVVVERDTSIDELNQYEIVDGQQRLTTVSILLCAIKEYYDNVGNNDAAAGVGDAYLWEEDEDFKELQKLKLNSLDNDQYRRLLQGNPPRQEGSRLREAIEYFSEKVVSLSEEEVDKLRKKLLNAITVVTIECDSQESAFRLFETLNDRGLELSQLDLIKNYLYKRAAEDPSINGEAIRQDWETIIDNIRYELDQPYRFLIHYILYAPRPDVTDNITENTLYDRFVELVEEDIPDSGVSLEEYISMMADDTLLYLDIINSNVNEFDSESDERINNLLDDLDRLGYTQERTYLMGVFSHLDNASEAIRATQLLEAFMIRQRFTSYITGSSLNELYAKICSHAFEREQPVKYIRSQFVEEAPSDEEIAGAFRRYDFPMSERTLFVLERLESEYCRRSGEPPRSGEIEHIAPRKAFTAKKYNTWPDYLSIGQEEFDQIKDKLGNLTILESRLNLEAQDDPFKQKKDRYEGSKYSMARSLREYDYWSAEVITERTEELAQAAAEIWNFEI